MLKAAIIQIKKKLPFWLKDNFNQVFLFFTDRFGKPTAGGLSFAITQHPLDPKDPVSKKFTKLGPWFTQFIHQGKKYGGSFSYEGDERVHDFFQWLDTEGRLLELASFEAGHTLMLAESPKIHSILGLDGRSYLLKRANFIRTLFNASKVEFKKCNFETDKLTKYGRFDVAFCSGLLYHLTEPWTFIGNVAEVTDRFFLSTHYSLTDSDTKGPYKGQIKQEFGRREPCSGLKDHAFWLSRESLISILNEKGFKVVHAKDFTGWQNGPIINLYCVKSDLAKGKS